MFDDLQKLGSQLQELVGKLRPESLEGTEAEALLQQFVRVERLASAGKALCAARVASSGVWRNGIDKSPARWIARTAGVSVGHALAILQTAQNLRELPQVEQAVRTAKISETQAVQISAAAAVSPSAQESLLAAARTQSVAELRNTCAQTVAAALPEESQRTERIHARRYLRSWRDGDGGFRLDGLLTPTDGASVMAALHPYVEKLASQARSQGRQESLQALHADALLAMANHVRDCEQVPLSRGPRAGVQVLVNHAALKRGYLVAGERCEIEGAGPIPVASARALASDALLSALLIDGEQIVAVSHLGRTINARLRTALQVRDRTCVVPGCYVSQDLQIDHILPVIEGGRTELNNLAHLCRWHHNQKTHHGYRLTGPPGRWTWSKPKQVVRR